LRARSGGRARGEAQAEGGFGEVDDDLVDEGLVDVGGEEAFHLGGGTQEVAATRGSPRVRREAVCGKAARILHSAGLRGCVAGADMV